MATLKSIKNKYLTASDGAVLGVTTNTENVSLLSFKLATADSLSKFNLVDGFADDYNDNTGVDVPTSTNEERNTADNYYSGTAVTAAGQTIYTADGTFTAGSGVTTVQYLVVAGGGGGGGGAGTNYGGGGGGAGGLRTGNYVTVGGNDYAVVVGDGGDGALGGSTSGGNSSFGTGTVITSAGGGQGGYNAVSTPAGAGGSGGGSSYHHDPVGAGNTPSTSPSQGNPGGLSQAGYAAGGGGGAGGTGSPGTGGNPYGGGPGGAGSDQSGTFGTGFGVSGVLAGGGGGGAGTSHGGGAAGTGGAGAGGSTGVGGAATVNTGSGGGGGGIQTGGNNSGGDGASGVVIVKWADSNVYNDMTLQSNAFTAQTGPTTARIILDEATVAGTTTLDTDIKAWASRDGTNFTQVSLASQGNISYNAGIDSYTKLIMHCDGGNAGVVFTDSSLTPHTITATNTTTSTTTPKFGTASAYFDGSGDYLSIPYSTDFDFGSGDITIDFWFRTPQVPNSGSSVPGNNTPIWGYCEYTGGRWKGWGFGGREKTAGVVTMMSLGMISDLSGAYAEPDDEIVIPIDNSWHHYAYVRQGTTAKIYKDGYLGSTYTGTAGNINASDLDTSSTLRFGIFEFTDVYWGELKGNLDEIRISKGIARWTSDFTPPSAPYSNDRRLLSGSVDISGQPAGTSMKYKIETLNQASSKQTRVYGTSMAWA